MKLKAVLYTGLMILGIGCSNDPSRLEGEREMLDGSVFVENIGRFIIENPPPLALSQPRANVQWTH